MFIIDNTFIVYDHIMITGYNISTQQRNLQTITGNRKTKQELKIIFMYTDTYMLLFLSDKVFLQTDKIDNTLTIESN